MCGNKRINKWIAAAASVSLAVFIVIELPAGVIADTYYLEDGSITVGSDTDGNQLVSQDQNDQVTNIQDQDPVISNRDPSTFTYNTVTINSEGTGENAAQVTLRDVNIFSAVSAAVKTYGDVVIEVDGTNILQAPQNHAALEKLDNGMLTIQDANGIPGYLEATGGVYSAGIGGADRNDGKNITITGGNITAIGGDGGAGIGSGHSGNGSNITITGGNVRATGGWRAAGIGGGMSGAGSDIAISDGNVTAAGGESGAGIGGGWKKSGSNITISGGDITATGGVDGAGIGGGLNGAGSNITISGGTVIVNGGENASGIGGGAGGSGSNNHITGGTVTVDDVLVDPEIPVNPSRQEDPVSDMAGADPISGGNTVNTATGDFGAYTAQLNVQINMFLQQIAALLASGRLDLLQAFMVSGCPVNLGSFTMLDAGTCNLLGQVLDAGVPVKIDYTYGGVSYRTTIPADGKALLLLISSDGVCTIEELMGTFYTQTL